MIRIVAERAEIILGLGHFVPERVVTNADMTRFMDTSDEWIQQRSGIVERHHVDAGMGPAELAFEAAKVALADAKLEASDIACPLLAGACKYKADDAEDGWVPGTCTLYSRSVFREPKIIKKGKKRSVTVSCFYRCYYSCQKKPKAT